MEISVWLPILVTILGLGALFVAQYRVGANREYRQLAEARGAQRDDLAEKLAAVENELREAEKRIAHLEGKYTQLLEMFEAGIASRVAEQVLEVLLEKANGLANE